MVSREQIEAAKAKLGDQAFNIMAGEIPLEKVNFAKLTCKSPFKEDDDTPSAHWYSDGNCLKCFATGMSMDYIDFLIRYKGKTFAEAVEELFKEAEVEYNPDDFKSDDEVDVYKNFKFAKDEPANDRKIVEEYLKRRRISPQTLDFCNVKQDGSGNIAYQFYDSDGKLIQTKYRVSSPAKNTDTKWHWQVGSSNCALLYGINKVNPSLPLVIVEGLNDRLACVEAGYTNAVSIPGGANDLNWIDFNFNILEKCKEIILWFDDDEPGQKAIRECVKRLGVYRTKTVQNNSTVKEKIKEFFGTNNIDKVDANNVLAACGKEYVLNMISNAKMEDNPRVQHLMDVEEVQINDLPKISMGFKAMNKIFSGNFENSLTILTGKSGNGKSSIINTMFVAAPLEAGEKVFIYSGEIPNGILLANVLKPLASNRHILEYENKGAPNGYGVTKQASTIIKKFYREEIFNYNDTNEFDTDSKSILQAMEYAYKRYGVKNFVVDSLLTIDYSHEYGDDKYEKQKNFVISLKTFTNTYPVRVVLVAHSRKLAPGAKEIGGDDIAGSSDILKCCNRAFSVEILWDDPEGYNTLVRCIKDRETGYSDKEVKLYYDRKSYRVYSDKEELNYKYRWEIAAEKNNSITYPKELLPRLVCNIKEPAVASEVLGEIKK
jgi:twinkle protein